MSYRSSNGFGYGTIGKAQKYHVLRIIRAKMIDECLKARTAKSFEQWKEQPNRFDLQTLTRQNRVQDKKPKYSF